MSKTRLLGLIGFLLFCIGVIFFTFNRHSKTGRFNYHSEIYADRAGYYVYLPAMFQYQFNPKKFPSGINEKIGEGFHYNTDSTRVITKYTYGVALMQLPFYLIAQTISYSQGTPSDGFSILNHKMVNLACVFYFLASLVILFRTFSNLYSNRTLLIVFGLIFLGTNLHYYAIFDTGMSHMYSFFLHSCVISLFYKTELSYFIDTKNFILKLYLV